MKILINAICAKKHAGGGFQISLNFVKAAMNDTTKDIEWYFLLSDHLAEALSIKKIIIFTFFQHNPILKELIVLFVRKFERLKK